ncbi:hypothetical protein N806_21470 [Rhodococcus sp. P27]|nr:hypothetical protein N806_21470 [Rhodococcus sp. P27]
MSCVVQHHLCRGNVPGGQQTLGLFQLGCRVDLRDRRVGLVGEDDLLDAPEASPGWASYAIAVAPPKTTAATAAAAAIGRTTRNRERERER